MANYDLASYILPVIVIYIVETNTFYSKNYYTIITILEKAPTNIEISFKKSLFYLYVGPTLLDTTS